MAKEKGSRGLGGAANALEAARAYLTNKKGKEFTSIRVALQETESPYSSFILGTIYLNSTPQTYTLTGWAPDDDNVNLNFFLGGTALRTIWIDAVSIQETSSDPDPYTCSEVFSRGGTSHNAGVSGRIQRRAESPAAGGLALSHLPDQPGQERNAPRLR